MNTKHPAYPFTLLPASNNFIIAELIKSGRAEAMGHPNMPTLEIFKRLLKTAEGMERVRAALDNSPINVTSWYRSPEVNAAVGSLPTSQHAQGEAVDFTCAAFGTPLDICRKLITLKDLIRFDQLILEPSWVHISFAIATGKPRGAVLTLLKSGKYSNGLTTRTGELL